MSDVFFTKELTIFTGGDFDENQFVQFEYNGSDGCVEISAVGGVQSKESMFSEGSCVEILVPNLSRDAAVLLRDFLLHCYPIGGEK